MNKLTTLPEYYLLGKRINGVYVEYVGPYSDYDSARTWQSIINNDDNREDEYEWKLLKYGRPSTID
jgi:hypothetical protein